MFRKYLQRSLLLVGSIVLIAGCNGRPTASESELDAVGLTNIWKDPKQIPTCWVQAFEANSQMAAYQAEVQKVVSENYARAGLIIVGWKPCTNDDFRRSVIRVELQPAISKILPNGHKGFKAGCSLVGPGNSKLNCDEKVRGATMWIDYTNEMHRTQTAVHEFGHAIGLFHEHERADRPSSCSMSDGKILSPSPEIIYLTKYDVFSIMDYCSGAEKLSELDVIGIKKLYGLSTGTTSTSTPPNNSCIDLKGKSFPQGTIGRARDGSNLVCQTGSWVPLYSK